jgi:U4/U6 small nuclear ribonucleoprotein SNU13
MLSGCRLTDGLTAWPLADAALEQEILDMVQQASHHRQLKKGANEGAYKFLGRPPMPALYPHDTC